MTPALSSAMARSLRAMDRQVNLVIDRHAESPSALARGTTRELGRVSNGLIAIANKLEDEAALVVASAIEASPEEARILDRLSELLTHRGTSWTDVSETLAAEGAFAAGGKDYKRERLIFLAIAAAGGMRYAIGSPADPTDPGAPRLFDLFNLPAEVGGAGGLAPLVRSCYNGEIKYGMTWRFATAADCLAFTVVDDDVDLVDDGKKE